MDLAVLSKYVYCLMLCTMYMQTTVVLLYVVCVILSFPTFFLRCLLVDMLKVVGSCAETKGPVLLSSLLFGKLSLIGI